jgi:DNA polymerase III epsilon subunit-like protein
MTYATVAHVDCETTGLDPRVHEPWEVAAIVGQVEYLWSWRPAPGVMACADPKALEVGRFHARAPKIADGSERSAAYTIAAVLEGHVIAGSNPQFDAGMLRGWLRRWHLDLNVHDTVIDVTAMAAGWLHGRLGVDLTQFKDDADGWHIPPYKSYQLSRLVGIDPPTDSEAHTALGDASWTKQLYEHITGTS